MKPKIMTCFGVMMVLTYYVCQATSSPIIATRKGKSFSLPAFLGGSIEPAIPPVPAVQEVAPIHQYPVWRIHKYNGLDLKPVPLSELSNLPLPIGKNIPVGPQLYPDFNVPASIPVSHLPQYPPISENKPEIPFELESIAADFGISDISKMPNLEQVSSMLGTSNMQDTIDAIRELASTPEGIDLIKSFLQMTELESPPRRDPDQYNVFPKKTAQALPDHEPLHFHRYPEQNFASPGHQYSGPNQQYKPPVQQYSAPSKQYSVPNNQYAVPVQQYATPIQQLSPPSQKYTAPEQFAAPDQHNAGHQNAAPIKQYAAPHQQYTSPEQYTASDQPNADHQNAALIKQYAAPNQQYRAPEQYPSPDKQNAAPVHQYISPAQQYSVPAEQSATYDQQQRAQVQQYVSPTEDNGASAEQVPSTAYRPALPETILSLSGISSAVERARTDVSLLREVLPKPETFFGRFRPFTGLGSLFNFGGSSEEKEVSTEGPSVLFANSVVSVNPDNSIGSSFSAPSTVNIPQRLVLPSLPDLPALPHIEGIRNVPQLPPFPQVHISSHSTGQNGFTGPYIRVIYPISGFNPVPQYGTPKSEYAVFEFEKPKEPQRELELPNINNGASGEIANHDIPPSIIPITQYALPDYTYPNIKATNKEDDFNAQQFAQVSQLPLENYDVFKKAPQILTSYGVPAQSYLSPNSDTNTAASEQEEEVVAFDNHSTQENTETELTKGDAKENTPLTDPNNIPELTSDPIDRRIDSQPQRISPYDFSASGKVYTARSEHIQLLPATASQNKAAIESSSDNFDSTDESRISSAVATMTSGFKPMDIIQ